MSIKSNVIIVESTKGFSSKLREYMQSKSVSTYVVTQLNEVKKLLDELAYPLVLVDLPTHKGSLKKMIDDLLAFEEAKQYPLFVLGSDGPGVEEQLSGAYKLVTGIRKPVSNAELYDAIKYTSDVFSFPSAKITKDTTPLPQEVEDIEDEAFGERSSEGIRITSPRIEPPRRQDTAVIDLDKEVHEIYRSFSSVPDLFFTQIDSYKLLEKNFNGVAYTHAITADSIKDKSYMPNDSKALNVIEDINSQVPSWAKTRLHRTSFMSNTIVRHLTSDPKLQEDARIASFLCNWTMASENKDLLRKDYVSAGSRTARKDVCSRMKDSAMKIAFEMGNSDVGNLVAKIGRFVGKEETAGDDPTSIIASAIATADMIDRTCWHSQYFNSRAAYKVMYMAKAGQLTDIHPAVLCAMIKLLAEAIASTTQVLLIPKEQRKDEKLLAAAKRNREQEIGEHEQKVSISELTPGMRLSQPLMAFDGREVLEEDLILDQDLIWRIWQLALIRPLNAPLIVKSER